MTIIAARHTVEQMIAVLDLAQHGKVPYPNADSVFFPDDPALEDKAQTACGAHWIALIEGDADPYVLITAEGRDILAALRSRLEADK